MSQTARILLGVSAFLLAAGFMALVPFMKDVSPQAGPGMAICGLFSGLIGVACLSRASQPITIRIIGGTVFLLSVLYLGNQILTASSFWDELDRATVRSRPGIYNSLGFFLIVGLPSGYAALNGRYPGWGAHAKAFVADDSSTQTERKA